MESLGVSELAERAGVTPPAVRFYERIGLLSPARRAPNGYRAFEETALEESAFVARANGVGMTLREITDLLAAWPSGECQSLQARVRPFLVERIDDVHEQLGELSAFERQLSTVLGRLSARDLGPERCGKGVQLRDGPRRHHRRPRSPALGLLAQPRRTGCPDRRVASAGGKGRVARVRRRHRAGHPEGRCHSDRHPGSTVCRGDRLLRPDPFRHEDRRRPGDAVHQGEGRARAARRPVRDHRSRRPMTSSRVSLVVVALSPLVWGSGRLVMASSARSLTVLRAHLSASGAIVSADSVRGGCAPREPATTG